jgi:large repetitive protein
MFLIALVIAGLFAGGRAMAAVGPNISINDVALTEGNSGTSNLNFTISLDIADPVNPTTITYATADNTAVAPVDYIAKSGTATIPANATSATITVVVNGDTLNEANETFFVNLTGNPSANATILDAQGTGTINNNDAAPKISIANAIVTEDLAGPSGMVFNASLSAASGQPISVTYATSDDTATTGLDYTAAPPTVLTFAPGEISKQIAIPISADALNEVNETFNVNLSNPVIATLNNTKGVGTINDDDPIPTISIDNPSIFEGGTGTTSILPFTVSLSAPSGKVVTVKYQTANGTASAPSDFTALPLTTLTFQPGTQSLNVNVSVKGDAINEADETFLINLSAPTNAAFTSSQGVGTIRNDDAPPTISIGDITVAEPLSGSATATFVVSLSAASGQPTSVNYATADGSASAGSDYQAQSGLVTFSPGEVTQQIVVPINSDQLVESNETFFINLSNAVNATFGDSQASGTITSTAGVPTVSISDKTATEGVDASAGLMVQLSAPSLETVTVTYVVAGGTAVAGADFQIPAAPLTLTFAPGISTQTIAVPILDDTLDEGDETFDITLTGAIGATIADGAAIGTIVDNDAPPTITISDVQVLDSGSTPNAIFTVSLSAPSSNLITVDYQTADGTATAGADYQAQSGKLTIPVGATSATITIPIIADTLVESDQTFSVNLGNAVNATLATATGICTIGDQPQTAPGSRVYVGIILH